MSSQDIITTVVCQFKFTNIFTIIFGSLFLLSSQTFYLGSFSFCLNYIFRISFSKVLFSYSLFFYNSNKMSFRPHSIFCLQPFYFLYITFYCLCAAFWIIMSPSSIISSSAYSICWVLNFNYFNFGFPNG